MGAVRALGGELQHARAQRRQQARHGRALDLVGAGVRALDRRGVHRVQVRPHGRHGARVACGRADRPARGGRRRGRARSGPGRRRPARAPPTPPRSRRAPRCWRCRCRPRCARSRRAARRRWRSPRACPCPPATTGSRTRAPPRRARPPAHRPNGRPPGRRATPPPLPVASRQYGVGRRRVVVGRSRPRPSPGPTSGRVSPAAMALRSFVAALKGYRSSGTRNRCAPERAAALRSRSSPDQSASLLVTSAPLLRRSARGSLTLNSWRRCWRPLTAVAKRLPRSDCAGSTPAPPPARPPPRSPPSPAPSPVRGRGPRGV